MNKTKSAFGEKKIFVISLGGSLINPGKIDALFLKKITAAIKKSSQKGNRFIIITGGGQPARDYQNALTGITKISADDLDWMGIYATRLHANFLKLIFGKLAHPAIIENFETKSKIKEKIILAGGWKPGRSSDGATAKLAKLYGAKTIINLSNVSYVYTKDPRKFKNTRPIKEISWKNFRKIIGYKWRPGANLPFDPIAAGFAQANKLRVIICNGKNLKNLEKILQGKNFKGTIIS